MPHAFVCAVRSPHLYVRHRCLSEHVPRARVCPLAGGPCDINDWPVATCQISPPPTLKVSPLLRTDVRGVATRSPGARLKKGGSRGREVILSVYDEPLRILEANLDADPPEDVKMSYT